MNKINNKKIINSESKFTHDLYPIFNLKYRK